MLRDLPMHVVVESFNPTTLETSVLMRRDLEASHELTIMLVIMEGADKSGVDHPRGADTWRHGRYAYMSDHVRFANGAWQEAASHASWLSPAELKLARARYVALGQECPDWLDATIQTIKDHQPIGLKEYRLVYWLILD